MSLRGAFFATKQPPDLAGDCFTPLLMTHRLCHLEGLVYSPERSPVLRAEISRFSFDLRSLSARFAPPSTSLRSAQDAARNDITSHFTTKGAMRCGVTRSDISSGDFEAIEAGYKREAGKNGVDET
jgi:hypothetical protein